MQYLSLSALLSLTMLAAGCDSSDPGADAAIDAATDAGGPEDAGPPPDAAPPSEPDAGPPFGDGLDLSGADLHLCMTDFPRVRAFRITNLLGDVDASLAVANSPTGGTYPPGTLIQLFPGEAMLKRGNGWNTMTNDWEFFALSVNAEATTITARGADDTVNMFGGNCFGCHSAAEPQWDLVCEQDHGCEPLGVDRSFIDRLQDSDPRCR